MSNTVIRARVDDEVKHEAMKVLKQMGLTASDAIRMLMVKIARERRLPFSPFEPNSEMLAAIEELDKGGGKKFHSVDHLMTDLDA